MLSTLVRNIPNLPLASINEISMKYARQLVSEKFNMESLADVELHIIDRAEDRISELNTANEPVKPIHYLAMLVEMSLYIGIEIGEKFSEEKREL